MRQFVYLIYYTEKGRETAEKAGCALEKKGFCCRDIGRPKGSAWVEEAWKQAAAFVFVCAAGIAVRMIAPYVEDKWKDPAVLVMDERGENVIPLLSGHAGGANALALYLEKEITARAVLTTATDVEGKFAVDLLACRENLLISDKTAAKEISAAVLAGRPVGLYSEFPLEGEVPSEIAVCQTAEALRGYDLGIWICQRGACEKKAAGKVLFLYPRNVVVGLGCKKDVSPGSMDSFYREVLSKAGIREEQVVQIASIDLKKEEKAILELAGKERVEFCTYRAEELETIKEVSEESDFVRKITGVGNVCERAALCGCGEGTLLLGRQKGQEMTAAVAAAVRRIRIG